MANKNFPTKYTEPLKVIADILQTKLGLKAGRVMLYNQKYNIPKDDKIFIMVGEEDNDVYAASTNTMDTPDGSGYEERNDVLVRATAVIDVLSAGPEARERKHEVIMALNSIYSQQMQELNSLRIANLPVGFVNTSDLEASQMLNRFTIKFNILYRKSNKNSVDYYDTFKTAVVGNKYANK